MKPLWILAFLVVLSTSVSRADSVILTLSDTASIYTDISTSPPVSLVVTMGACSPVPSLQCGMFSGPFLDPISFLPSNSSQTVTITAGTRFSEVAGAIGSGAFNANEFQMASSDGSVWVTPPSGFPFIGNNPIGGQLYGEVYTGYPGATVTSIVVTIGPFVFQPFLFQPSPGVEGLTWVAQSQSSPVIEPFNPGTTPSNYPAFEFDVYAATPLPPYVPPPPPPPPPPVTTPEPSSILLLGTGLLSLLAVMLKRIA
jgi:hypothetical protein